MHGMEYHLVAASGYTTANGLWKFFGVGAPPARVCSSVPGVWLHLCMELGIVVFPGWEDAFQVYGQFRRAITGGVCVAWRESCQQAYMYVCISVVRPRTLSPYVGLWPPCLCVCGCVHALLPRFALAWWRRGPTLILQLYMLDELEAYCAICRDARSLRRRARHLS